MGLKKVITSVLSVALLTSTLGLNVFAEETADNNLNVFDKETTGNGTFKLVNAPSEAEFSIYTDVNKNYIYDENEDIFVGSFQCDDDGVGYISNLESGDYVAVLQTDYSQSNIVTNEQYSFTSNGNDYLLQEALTTIKNFRFNNVKSATNQSVQISYDVPLFKQGGDNVEWSNSYINGSSDTMRNSGCLITSFAMLRSYQVGYNVLPTSMMQQYSSDTNVGVDYVYYGDSSMIVPSSAGHYGWTVYGNTGEFLTDTTFYDNPNYLKILYQKLQNGPVIFGAYRTPFARGGSNHWVVVKGYSGDGVNFSPEDFSICDPTYSIVGRSNLGELLRDYPYWDRLVYLQNNIVSNNSVVANSSVNSNVLMGDVNFDGNVDIADLLMVKKYILEMVTLDSNTLKRIDFNNDGLVLVNDYVTLKIIVFDNL